jgi:hypothetical protein
MRTKKKKKKESKCRELEAPRPEFVCRLPRESVLKVTIPNDGIVLPHLLFLSFSFEQNLVGSLTTDDGLSVSDENRHLLWFPSATASSLTDRTGSSEWVSIQLAI